MGVCIAPQTEVHRLAPVLAYKTSSEKWLVQLVNLLGVNPGFGGQTFQQHTLEKIRSVRQLVAQVRGGADPEGGCVVSLNRAVIEP